MPTPVRWPLWRAVVAVVALLALPSAALAQSPQSVPPAANKLYAEAAAAMIKKNYAVACPKFEEVSRMVPDGGGVRLNLAECYEEQGKLASAYVQYGIAETLALKDGRKDRSKAAIAGAARVKPKLAMLVVTVPDNVRSLPDLAIKLDGEVLGAKVWGVPYPVDRGPHSLVATARGYAPKPLQVDVARDGITTTTTIPALDPAPAEPGDTAGPGAPPPSDPEGPAGPPAKEHGVFSPPVRTAALIGGGALALGGLAAGGVMLGVSFGKADEKQRANMDPFGRVTARAAAEAEAGARNVAIWCLAGGGLALAGTAVLYFVTRPGPTAPVKAGAAVGPKGPSLWIEGQF